MANEAVLRWERSKPLNFLCANANTIELGSILKLYSPMTLSGGTVATGDVFGGITAQEKLGGDGVTSVAAYRDGVFLCYLSGSATVGDVAIMSATPNMVASGAGLAANVLSGSRVIGSFLQTGTTGQQVLVDVNPMAIPMA